MYNTLAKYLDGFEVWYFQKQSVNRPWKFDERKLQHRFWVASGLYYAFPTYNLFLNPHLVIKLLYAQPVHLILAAGWNDLDVLLFLFLKSWVYCVVK